MPEPARPENGDGRGDIPATWGCAKCAMLGKTCCQQREIFVTLGDRQRVALHTGLQDFWEDRSPADPSYLDQSNDPNWLQWVFRTDGTRPVLKRQPNGDCRFLGSQGCTLPTEVRPLVCRLYPYEYCESGIIGIASDCPREVVPPGSTILKVLDMRLADALRWHRILYNELRSSPASEDSFHDRGHYI